MAAARRLKSAEVAATASDMYALLETNLGSAADIKPLVVDMLSSQALHTPIEYLKFKTYIDRYLFRRNVNCRNCDLLTVFNQASAGKQRDILQTVHSYAAKFHPRHPILHILTDVDDTLYAHRAVGIAGTDYSWFEKKQYPGLAALYHALNDRNPDFLQYVTILSATPLALKRGRLANTEIIGAIGKDYSFLHGKESTWEAIADFARGSVTSAGEVLRGTRSISTMFGVDNESVAATKIERFDTYRALSPEFTFCFIGDNGQGDVVAGVHMLRTSPTALVCIHNVLKASLDGTYTRAMSAEEIDTFYEKHEREGLEDIRARLVFFTTYVQLAGVLNKKRLITPQGLQHVKEAAQDKVIADCRADGIKGSDREVVRECVKKYPMYFQK
jgi:hypothetical protein